MALTSASSTSELQTTTQTPSPTEYEAVHAVLFTNELLCNIVSYLPLEDIVVTTGICRSWRKALQDNLRIQELLFLKPVEPSEALVRFPEAYSDDAIALDECDYSLLVGELHPSTNKICGNVMWDGGGQGGLYKDALFPRFDHSGGLWRDMFMTQPPCKHVSIFVWGAQSGYIIITDGLGHCEAGWKLGELYDMFHSNLSTNSQESKGYTRIFGFVPDHESSSLYWLCRCKVRDGEVYRPAKPFLDSNGDRSDDSESE